MYNAPDIPTGLDVSALRITKVGMLVVEGERLRAHLTEFSNPVNWQQMTEEMGCYVDDTDILLGFVVFDVDGSGTGYHNPAATAEQAKAISNLLRTEFVPEGVIVYEVVNDPDKGPCFMVPLDENGEPDFGPVN